jgi:hypothetical protein
MIAELADGRRLEFPDGTDPAIVQSTVKRMLMVRPRAPIETPQFEKDAADIANATPSQVIAGNPVIRGAIGAADMVRGGVQLLGNSPGLSWTGLGQATNKNESSLQAIIDAGRKAYGDSGMDVSRILGGMLSPVGLKGAQLLGPATTAVGRIGQGTTIGGVSGLLSPVVGAQSGSDYAGQAAANTGIGAVTGGLLTGGLEMGKGLIRGARNILDEFVPGGSARAVGRMGNAVAGKDAPKVINALENSVDNVPGSNLTAGQAAVPANSAEFAALQKIASEYSPSKYFGAGGVEGRQEAARKALIDTIANDPAFANPSVSPLRAAELVRDANAALGYGKVRGDMINPIAPEEVFAARIAAKEASKAGALQDYGRFLTAAAQQENLANGGGVRLAPTQPNQGGTGPSQVLSAKAAERAPRIQSEAAPQMNVGATGGTVTSPSAYPVPGQPRIPPRYTDNAQRVGEFQAGAQDAMTIATQRQKEADFIRYQLDSLIKTVGPENPKLAQLLQRPSMQKALISAQEGAQESGGYFPAKAGDSFSVSNLQRMKQAMDDIIKDPKTFGIKATEAMEIGNTRNEFVKWLSKRSPGWATARDQYAADSLPVNRMQIGGLLGKSLDTPTGVGERAGMFGNAMENARLTQKKANGFARYDTIDEALGPEGSKKVQAVMKDLLQKAEFENLASAGMKEARRITNIQLDTIPQVGMLDRAMMIINNVTRRVEGFGGIRTMKELGEIMQDPKEMARLMREATPKERNEIVTAILGQTGAVVNLDGKRQYQ